MMRIGFYIVVLCMLVAGCAGSSDIVKVVDFELSPDEEKIAFSAVTPIGNTDIWVLDIDGSNLKKLTFKDRSPSNHIARFFRKHKWRNFFEVDMRSPEWTKDGRIAFCQRLTKHDNWGWHTVSLRYWTIEPDGRDKKQITEKDEIRTRVSLEPIKTAKTHEESNKYKRKIILKDGMLWALDFEETIPKKLIQ